MRAGKVDERYFLTKTLLMLGEVGRKEGHVCSIVLVHGLVLGYCYGYGMAMAIAMAKKPRCPVTEGCM